MGVSARPRHWAGSLIKTKREPSAHCSSGSSTHSNWYTLFVFDLVLLWLLSPSAHFSVAAGAHTQHSSASIIESQSIMTPPHESGNLIRQDKECLSILKSLDSSVAHDTKYKPFCRSHCANFISVFNNHIHRFLTQMIKVVQHIEIISWKVCYF